MNKKIDIYTLLGLIKDGKAPENIKYQDKVYYKGKFSSNIFYFCNDKLERINLTHFDNLNDEVEILDKEDEFIDIEEIDEEKLIGEEDAYFACIINDLIKNQRLLINKIKDSE